MTTESRIAEVGARARREGYPPHPAGLPGPVGEVGDFKVGFARQPEELEKALRLRYEVFNLELNEGLEASRETGLDEDEFDAVCHHLLVEHVPSGEVVGTYRMQTAAMAGERGFYSAGEFDLAGVPREVIDSSAEIGRACIAREHRNRQLLFLLWRGLAAYWTYNRVRYLFGCCSLTSQDAREGLEVLAFLDRKGVMHPDLSVQPLPGLECRVPDGPVPSGDGVELPKLFRTYLRYGVKVCGPPAIDRQFKTIDFLVLFDVENLDPLLRRLLF